MGRRRALAVLGLGLGGAPGAFRVGRAGGGGALVERQVAGALRVLVGLAQRPGEEEPRLGDVVGAGAAQLAELFGALQGGLGLGGAAEREQRRPDADERRPDPVARGPVGLLAD